MTSRVGWVAVLASAVFLGGCSSSSDDERDDAGRPRQEPTTPTGSATAPTGSSTAPTTTPTDVVLTQDLPSGRPPHVPYLVGRRLSPAPWRLVGPDGTSQLVRKIPGEFAPLGGGIVSLVSAEGVSSVFVLGSDGRLVERPSYTSSSRLVVGAAGRAVGWVSLDRAKLRRSVVAATTEVRFADGRRWLLPARPDTVLVGIRGGAACARRHDRCRVVVSEGRRTYVVGPHSRRRITSHPAVDVRADLTTISSRSGTLCSAMWTPAGRRVWRDCHHGAVSFSPSGRHVLAIEGEGTQVATRRIFILDDRGRVESTFRAPRRLAIMGATWEDDRHLLLVVSRDWTTSYVVRVAVDGHAELVFPSQGRIRTLVTYQLPTR
ncbi:MAG: hypothetical protein QM747_08055 [Nocardioides sp.]